MSPRVTCPANHKPAPLYRGGCRECHLEAQRLARKTGDGKPRVRPSRPEQRRRRAEKDGAA